MFKMFGESEHKTFQQLKSLEEFLRLETRHIKVQVFSGELQQLQSITLCIVSSAGSPESATLILITLVQWCFELNANINMLTLSW